MRYAAIFIGVREGRKMRPEHWLFTIPLRLRSLFRWAQADQELDDEMRDHLERKTGEYMAQGMRQEEAHRRARLDLGGVEQTKEKCRDLRPSWRNPNLERFSSSRTSNPCKRRLLLLIRNSRSTRPNVRPGRSSKWMHSCPGLFVLAKGLGSAGRHRRRAVVTQRETLHGCRYHASGLRLLSKTNIALDTNQPG